eukprot:gene17419-20784_t
MNLKRIKGVIFDLDGTLTVPCMDFAALRQSLGIAPGAGDVLEVIKTWPADRQKEGHDIIHSFELDARNRTIVQPGVSKLLNMLESKNIHRAIHSRNTLVNVEHFSTTYGFSFSLMVGREVEPPKPHPSGCLHINKTWLLSPDEILFSYMISYYYHY